MAQYNPSDWAQTKRQNHQVTVMSAWSKANNSSKDPWAKRKTKFTQSVWSQGHSVRSQGHLAGLQGHPAGSQGHSPGSDSLGSPGQNHLSHLSASLGLMGHICNLNTGAQIAKWWPFGAHVCHRQSLMYTSWYKQVCVLLGLFCRCWSIGL